MDSNTAEITISVRKKLVVVTVELGRDLAKAGLRELLFPLFSFSSFLPWSSMIGESERQRLTQR